LSTDWNFDGDNNPEDMDEDGWANDYDGSTGTDSHPRDPNLWSDWDGNGINNDTDWDEDNVLNEDDSHPMHAHLWSDWDFDQINNDTDGDNDGVLDSQDSDPRNPSLSSDWNHDGDDNPSDWDEDGYDNGSDSHPTNASLWDDFDVDGFNAADDSHPADNSRWSDWNDDGTNNATDGDEDGTPHLAAAEPPPEFPPAVLVTGAGILGFVGTLEGGACYTNPGALGNAEPDAGAQCLLQLRSDGTVTLTQYVTGGTQTGRYSTQTHLFQTGTSNSLPVPLLAVAPNASDTLWGLSTPADAPATFQVGGQLWRYAGTGAGGAATYQGYYTGQLLTLGAAGAGGGRSISVTDPVRENTSGLLNDVRAGTRLGNGVMVYAAGSSGARASSSINGNNLAALTGNLDIPGNVLTLGSLSGDAAAAGLTLQFTDSMINGGNVALLRQRGTVGLVAHRPRQRGRHRAGDGAGQRLRPGALRPGQPQHGDDQAQPQPGGGQQLQRPTARDACRGHRHGRVHPRPAALSDDRRNTRKARQPRRVWCLLNLKT